MGLEDGTAPVPELSLAAARGRGGSGFNPPAADDLSESLDIFAAQRATSLRFDSLLPAPSWSAGAVKMCKYDARGMCTFGLKCHNRHSQAASGLRHVHSHNVATASAASTAGPSPAPATRATPEATAAAVPTDRERVEAELSQCVLEILESAPEQGVGSSPLSVALYEECAHLDAKAHVQQHYGSVRKFLEKAPLLREAVSFEQNDRGGTITLRHQQAPLVDSESYLATWLQKVFALLTGRNNGQVWAIADLCGSTGLIPLYAPLSTVIHALRQDDRFVVSRHPEPTSFSGKPRWAVSLKMTIVAPTRSAALPATAAAVPTDHVAIELLRCVCMILEKTIEKTLRSCQLSAALYHECRDLDAKTYIQQNYGTVRSFLESPLLRRVVSFEHDSFGGTITLRHQNSAASAHAPAANSTVIAQSNVDRVAQALVDIVRASSGHEMRGGMLCAKLYLTPGLNARKVIDSYQGLRSFVNYAVDAAQYSAPPGGKSYVREYVYIYIYIYIHAYIYLHLLSFAHADMYTCIYAHTH